MVEVERLQWLPVSSVAGGRLGPCLTASVSCVSVVDAIDVGVTGAPEFANALY